MYQIDSSREVLSAAGKLLRQPSQLGVSRKVWLLGLTSLFTDISSEMVTSVLPLYALVKLKLDPLAIGLIGGVYLGAGSLVRLVGGGLADRTGRYKAVAAAGYTLSMASRVGLIALGGSWTSLLWLVSIDRLGKGIRSDARDALISFSVPRERLATAFGVHRALDTVGAMIGPLMAFGLLWVAPGAYDAVFVVSLCAALIGLSVLVLFVENAPAVVSTPTRREQVTLGAAVRLLRLSSVRPLLIAGAVLNLATISDTFFFLTLQRRLEFQVGFFPLLYVATSAVYMILALPAGVLADRAGRTRVFIGSHVLLVLAYAALLRPSLGGAEIAGYVVLLGAYYAGTDGVLMALVSARLPRALRSTGMAQVTTLAGLARFAGSLLFGWLWTWGGLEFAVATAAGALLAAIVLGVFLLGWKREMISFDDDPSPS
jgi:MFS family permease